MRVSATELKMNMSKSKKRDALKSLRGMIKDVDMTRDEIREERLGRRNDKPA